MIHPDASQDLQREEHALVGRLRAGDPDAFAVLMAQYIDQLTRFAQYMLGSRDSADDVVQQVFVELWQRRSTLEPHRLKSFLYRAVRNRSLNERSARAVRERYKTDILGESHAGGAASTLSSPEDDILTAEAYRSAMEQLSERRQLAIRLRVEEGMSHAEIAEVLGLSATAAQSLVARAMLDLRRILWDK